MSLPKRPISLPLGTTHSSSSRSIICSIGIICRRKMMKAKKKKEEEE